MKLLLFLLSLSIGFHLCSCDPDEISNELTQRRPPPPRRLPPPPPRRPPPPPTRRPPPPPAIPPCPPSNRNPSFNHFILTLTWPNAFCKLPFVACRPFPPKQYFTIHGLWPVNQFHNSVTDCKEESGRELTEAILNQRQRQQDLLDYWPRLYNAKDLRTSKKLWRDQWCKHGSCSSNQFTPADYFDNAIALGKTYSPLINEKLKDAGIIADDKEYSWENIVTAIKEAVGNVNVRLSCEEDDSGKLQLTEIQICVNSDATTLNNCNRQTTARCQKNLVFASEKPLPPPPPPPPRSLETPIFVSSILEVEEAAGL